MKENKYKTVEFLCKNYVSSHMLEDELNLQYTKGWEFVQMIPQNEFGFIIIFKRKEKAILDITPNDIWPASLFKTGDEVDATLREVLDSFGDDIYEKYPIRIYSRQNKSVVGSVINGNELIPDNVLKYKYISMKVKPNTRDKKMPDILVITVE